MVINSKPTASLEQSLERLFSLRTFGIKPGLETMHDLMARCGNPEQSLLCIHVAGTNGKGSVCAMLDAMVRAAGVRVGLYTSPHLIRFNERIRVNGESISDAELAELFEALEEPARQTVRATGRELTFFEMTTAMALDYFKRKAVQIVVLETGLGGRLDATNIVTPLLSVITRIGIDHAPYLGDTVEKIASEKAGIIKPGRPVVCGDMPEDALDVIRKAASGKKAPLILAAEVVTVQQKRGKGPVNGQKITLSGGRGDYGSVVLPLSGRYQLENCATAVAAMEQTVSLCSLPVSGEAIRQGLEHVTWLGRLQTLQEDPLVLLDGAHNPDAAEALATSLRDSVRRRPLGIMCGMCADKDNQGFLKAFTRLNPRRFWAVGLKTARSVSPDRLKEMAAQLRWPVAAETSITLALKESTAWAQESGGVILITGSLYLVGEVLEIKGYGKLQAGF